MDLNLLYWKAEGQSFLRRFKIWSDLLNPILLFSSYREIRKARYLLGSGKILNDKNESALTISLSCVHPDSGAPLPVFFRPPAFFPISFPWVVLSLLPHSTVKPALFCQFLVQSYSAGFNYANRNSSSEQHQGRNISREQLLMIANTVSFATCAGALPQIFIRRLGLRSPTVLTFFKSILPIPLSATVAAFNVLTVRREESETGIQVFDSNGNPVGMSKAAGKKAVWETALSRAALFGVTAAVPNLLMLLLMRMRPFQRNPPLIAPVRNLTITLVLSLMIPVSFSLFPQLGTIKREQLEEELQAAAIGRHLFYHRGL